MGGDFAHQCDEGLFSTVKNYSTSEGCIFPWQTGPAHWQEPPCPAHGTSAAQEGPAFMGLWFSSRPFVKGLLDVLMSPAAVASQVTSLTQPYGKRSKYVFLNTSQFSKKILLKGINFILKISKNNWRGIQSSSSQATLHCCTELSTVWLAGLQSTVMVILLTSYIKKWNLTLSFRVSFEARE